MEIDNTRQSYDSTIQMPLSQKMQDHKLQTLNCGVSFHIFAWCPLFWLDWTVGLIVKLRTNSGNTLVEFWTCFFVTRYVPNFSKRNSLISPLVHLVFNLHYSHANTVTWLVLLNPNLKIEMVNDYWLVKIIEMNDVIIAIILHIRSINLSANRTNPKYKHYLLVILKAKGAIWANFHLFSLVLRNG